MAKVEKTFSVEVKMHGEIRRAEWEENNWTDKEGKTHESKTMHIKVLTDNDDMAEIYDKQSDAIQTYQRGQVGTFTLRLDYKPTYGAGNMEAKMLVVGFEQDGGRQRPRRADEG